MIEPDALGVRFLPKKWILFVAAVRPLFLCAPSKGDELGGASPLRAPIPGTANQIQGCPERSGIWRKEEVKSRADEQEADIRRRRLGEWAINHEARWDPEDADVNPTATWEEGSSSIPGEISPYARKGNTGS
jgi:hypothetical protein